MRCLRQIDARTQSEPAVELAHPFGIALGEILVDGDNMHTLACQRVQIRGQRRHQRLALACTHLGDFALMKHHAADQLHNKVPHLQYALAGLAADGKGFGQNLISGRACGEPGFEFGCFRLQRLVG